MSRPEIEKIAEELSGDMTAQEFIETYDKIMAKQKYNFMVYDARRPLDSRWTERFTIPIEKSQRLKLLYSNRNGEEVSDDIRSGEDSE